MSLYRWLVRTKSPTKPYLPDPSKEESDKDALEVEAANQCVEKELGRKRRGTYSYYDPELRAKTGKYAATSGNAAAVRKFSEQLGKPISESTVRGFKKAYCSALSESRSAEPITRLEHRLRGRPLLLGDLDSNVQQYVRKLRLAGGIVNRAIVIAAATGIVEHNNPALLHTHGGTVVDFIVNP